MLPDIGAVSKSDVTGEGPLAVLTGESGSGKSVLLHLAGGRLAP
jgi:ABC-type lipoprotein export system ATPase subunit